MTQTKGVFHCSKVLLRVSSDALVPDQVTHRTGIVPTQAHAKGDIVPGKRIPMYRGIWAIGRVADDVEDASRQVLAVVGDKKQVIHEAAAACSAAISVGIWWEPRGGQGGYTLPSDLVRELAGLGERVDFYYASTGLEEGQTTYDHPSRAQERRDLAADAFYQHRPKTTDAEAVFHAARVSLMLSSDALVPEQVTHRTGIVPTWAHAKGDRVPGQSVPEPRGVWGVEGVADEVAGASRQLLAAIGDKKRVIHEASADCSGTIRVGIWWEPRGGFGGYTLSSDLVRELAGLGERVDFYFASTGPDDEESSTQELAASSSGSGDAASG